MKSNPCQPNRRKFFQESAMLTAGLLAAPLVSYAHPKVPPTSEDLYLLGPMEGYDPHIGALLSSMNMVRTWVIYQVKELTVDQLA